MDAEDGGGPEAGCVATPVAVAAAVAVAADVGVSMVGVAGAHRSKSSSSPSTTVPPGVSIVPTLGLTDVPRDAAVDSGVDIRPPPATVVVDVDGARVAEGGAGGGSPDDGGVAAAVDGNDGGTVAEAETWGRVLAAILKYTRGDSPVLEYLSLASRLCLASSVAVIMSVWRYGRTGAGRADDAGVDV